MLWPRPRRGSSTGPSRSRPSSCAVAFVGSGWLPSGRPPASFCAGCLPVGVRVAPFGLWGVGDVVGVSVLGTARNRSLTNSPVLTRQPLRADTPTTSPSRRGRLRADIPTTSPSRRGRLRAVAPCRPAVGSRGAGRRPPSRRSAGFARQVVGLLRPVVGRLPCRPAAGMRAAWGGTGGRRRQPVSAGLRDPPPAGTDPRHPISAGLRYPRRAARLGHGRITRWTEGVFRLVYAR